MLMLAIGTGTSRRGTAVISKSSLLMPVGMATGHLLGRGKYRSGWACRSVPTRWAYRSLPAVGAHSRHPPSPPGGGPLGPPFHYWSEICRGPLDGEPLDDASEPLEVVLCRVGLARLTDIAVETRGPLEEVAILAGRRIQDMIHDGLAERANRNDVGNHSNSTAADTAGEFEWPCFIQSKALEMRRLIAWFWRVAAQSARRPAARR